MKRLLCFFALGLVQTTLSSAQAACMINEIQRADMRNGFCSQDSTVATVRGCTAILMRSQVADQFEQIALARRCGFGSEADKLENYYKQTTPLVVQLYECVDDRISQPNIEKAAHEDVDKKLSGLAPGCPDDLKAKMQKRLPSLISSDATSLGEIKKIGKQIGLTPP